MSNEISGRRPFTAWEIVSDERLIIQRAIVPGEAYEMVKIIEEPSGDYKFLHEVIFCRSYNRRSLEQVLAAFGYKSLEEFVSECSGKPVAPFKEIPKSGINWGLLSMFICDTHDDGILMDKEEAIRTAKTVTGISIFL